ncbi:putative inactive ATP-dependent zinc metalloprotease FTSHI 4 [Arachis hypogaea]|nr:putative inactive ATP-dependent zinc metalloprotease FTSHI 4 [Arachis hypogaea]
MLGINSFAQRHLDYIGRDELLEALKRVGGFSASFWQGNIFFLLMCLMFSASASYLIVDLVNLQRKGTFETGQEDSAEIPEKLKLRLAYREVAVAVLVCYYPEPHHFLLLN